MAYKVLVVDDSQFFQVRLKEIINEHPELSVVGVAANGHEAIELDEKLKPDVISMDYEMPFLDGVSAVRAILAKRAVPIVMFSSMTYEGARITLDALDAGAVDFIPKNFAEVSKSSVGLKRKLHDTLLTFARKSSPSNFSTPTGKPVAPASPNFKPSAPEPENRQNQIGQSNGFQLGRAESSARPEPINRNIQSSRRSLKNKLKLVVIGSSTGGPVALTEVIQKLPASFHLPLVVIQHMPENFTKALADRLNSQCAVRVKEAESGDVLEPGSVLVAPGGKQLIFDKRGSIKILPGDERVNYKPSVDITFASASNLYRNQVLGVVLTGMGADGCEGARLLKQQGSYIWGQDRASCVVYGMPKAVATAGLCDDVIPLDKIGDRLVQDL